MNSRYTKGRRAGYTANVERPSRQGPASLRTVGGLALTLLLPPVGLLVLWHQGIFRARGRMVLTVLATVEMTALFVLLAPRQPLTTHSPVPAPPPQVTAGPDEENLTALYNIDDIIYERQLAEVMEQGGTERDLMTEEEKLDLDNARNEEIYATTVYSVYNDAIYYHATKVCRTQTNGRELTVRDALREGMQPCPYCNPPVPSA